MAKQNCLVKISGKINRGFEKLLEKYATFVFRYPCVPILGAILLLGILAYGFTLYEESTDAIKDWIPEGAEALDDRDTIEKYYETESLPTVFYLVAKNEGDNVITLDIYQAIKDFDTRFKEEVEYDGEKYADICFKPIEDGSCDTSNHPLDFFLNSDGLYDLSSVSSNSELLTKIESGKGDSDLYPEDSSDYIRIASMFGETTPKDITTNSDGTNDIEEAEAIQWTYFFNGDDFDQEDFYEEYDKKLEDFVDEFNEENEYMKLYVWTSTGIFRAARENAEGDLAFIAVGIVLIIIYTLIVLGKCYTYNSRLFVAMFGIISVLIAYVEAMALASYLEIIGNGMVNVVPFMLLGIGVDDMFVLLFALDETPIHLSGKDKMKYMMRTAGVSITITSVTNVCTFGMGAITSIRGVKHFCIYACFGMLFDYLNQMTLFIGILSMDIRRSEKKKGDCCGLIYCKPDSAFCCHGKLGMNSEGGPREPLMKKIMRDYYGPFLMKNPVRIAVILFFTGFMAFNIYGAAELELDWDFEWFVQDHFEVKDSLDIRDKYFDDSGWTIKYYTVEADFKNENIQRSLIELEELISDCNGCGDDWFVKDTTESWYTVFNNWIDNGNCEVLGNTVNLESNGLVPEDTFYKCLGKWQDTDEGEKYLTWLSWNDGETELKGGFIKVDSVKVEGADNQIDFMGDTRDIADKGPDETFAYHPEYLWIEHKAVFQVESTISFSGSLVAAFVIILIMMADIIGAVFSILMVGLTVVGQLSLLYWWNEHLNIITMVHTIMAIGISVDYSAHISQAFKTSHGEDRKERIIKAFDHVGVAVFNGGFSTFLAIMPLVAAETYIYRTFFKCWFAIVLYGISHGLILLPVILSLVGSPPLEEGEEKESEVIEDQSPGENEGDVELGERSNDQVEENPMIGENEDEQDN